MTKPHPFVVPYQREQEHAAALTRGLAALPAGFIAEICQVCEGTGSYVQRYTVGCGMGSFKSLGPCSYCEQKGMTQNGKAAPDSVVNQVLIAGERA